MYLPALLRLAACAVAPPAGAEPATLAPFDELLTAWPPRPRLAARQMTQRYGSPADATSEELIWRDAGPFARIVVSRRELPHDFPRPHFDFLSHTIAYRVPPGEPADLLAFDGSLVVDRTAGELSARGDDEGHNVLALNLAHDVASGAITVEEAREAFGKALVDEALGRAPRSMSALRFEPAPGPTTDPDAAVVRGSPVRPPADRAGGEGDVGEILGFVVALDDLEIQAAAEAERRPGASTTVRAYAAMLHAEHGQDLVETLDLGETVGVDPLETRAVDALRQAAAADLARLVPLEGAAFDDAWIAAMVDAHHHALALLDRFVDEVPPGPVEQRLIDARGHARAHLEAGRDLGGPSALNAPSRRR